MPFKNASFSYFILLKRHSFLPSIVWLLSPLAIFVFLVSYCVSTLGFSNHLENRHTYTRATHTHKHTQNTSNVFIKQSNCSDPGQLYIGFYSVHLKLDTVWLFVPAPRDNAHLLVGWHSFICCGGVGTSIVLSNKYNEEFGLVLCLARKMWSNVSW